MKPLFKEGMTQVFISEDGKTVTWTGKADIDNDGPDGNPEHDPDHQNSTSLRHADGSFFNSETELGIVIPEDMIALIAPEWLGSQVYVSYKGQEADAVVYDFGPRGKIGEISVALAKRLGIPPSPIDGGVSSGVSYTVKPGQAAIVEGRKYQLQRA